MEFGFSTLQIHLFIGLFLFKEISFVFTFAISAEVQYFIHVGLLETCKIGFHNSCS